MNTPEFKEKTVAELVSENIKTAHVFKKYGIDFCCGGGKTIEEACKKNKVEITKLQHELIQTMNSTTPSVNYNLWSLDFLCEYIEQTHHKYIHESIPIIEAYVTKVAKVHGDAAPETIEIKRLFGEVVAELIPHMQKEELVLFPYIRKIVRSKKEGFAAPNPSFGTIKNPINMMTNEHDIAGRLLKEINILSSHYHAPEWACNTFKALYAKLEEFENDLHIHIHLENNILFPKAIEFESLNNN